MQENHTHPHVPDADEAREPTRGRPDTRVETGNTDLLTATLQQRRSRARASTSPRLAGRPSGAGRS